MTLTLEISPEAEAQIERAAAATQTDVSTFLVTAGMEKAARVFDEGKFGALLDSDPMAALDYLLDHTPQGAAPLADDAVARSYKEYHDHKAAA